MPGGAAVPYDAKDAVILRTLIAAALAALALSGLTAIPAAGGPVPTVVTLLPPASPRVALNAADEVTGTVAGVPSPSGRRVDLQLRTPTGWYSIVHTTTDPAGGFRIAVPTWWYGAHTWRAAVAATDTTAAATSTQTVSVTVRAPAAAGRASAYRRMPGRPRWNACKRVPYIVNLAGAPGGALADIRYALRQITAGSGIRFVYRGRTALVPWSGRGPRNGMPAAGLAYAFTTPRVVHSLAGSTVGIGGGAYTSSARGNRFTHGGVALDRTFHGSRLVLRNVLMHETGHAVGLDHVKDRHEVMYPTVNGSDHWGRGDLAGLAAVGLSAGC